MRARLMFDVFKKLAQSFMTLTQEIDAFDDENVITAEKYNMLLLKYGPIILEEMLKQLITNFNYSYKIIMITPI